MDIQNMTYESGVSASSIISTDTKSVEVIKQYINIDSPEVTSVMELIDNLTATVTNILDIIVEPFNTALKTIESLNETAESAYDSANAVYMTYRVTNPAKAEKYKKLLDDAKFYKDKVYNNKKHLNTVAETLKTWRDEAVETVNKANTSSKQWIQDRLNFIINEVNRIIQNAVEEIEKRITKLENKVKEKAQKIIDKELAKIEERNRAYYESQLARENAIKEQNNTINETMKKAPKI